MIASKVKDDYEYRLIHIIDEIILNNNLKVEDIDDLYEKCIDFYNQRKNNDVIYNIDIEGFNFVNPQEQDFNKELEDFIIKTINEKGRI